MISIPKAPVELRNGYKDKEHLAKVGSLPCIACQKLGIKQKFRTEVHHFIGMGIGKRASDLLTIPLCSIHHRKGNRGEAIHEGLKIWEEKFGTQRELLEEVKNLLDKQV